MSTNAVTMKRCLWIFATLGPFFGYATVMSLIVINEADGVLAVLMLPLGIVMFAPFGMLIAWFVGLMPAILTGVVYWALRTKAAAGAAFAMVLSAVAAGILCAGVVALSGGLQGGLLDVETWLTLIVPAIVATLLCAPIVERGSKQRYE